MSLTLEVVNASKLKLNVGYFLCFTVNTSQLQQNTKLVIKSLLIAGHPQPMLFSFV